MVAMGSLLSVAVIRTSYGRVDRPVIHRGSLAIALPGMGGQVSRRPLPACEQVLAELDAEQVVGAVDGLGDLLLQRRGPLIECPHRRRDHSAQLADLDQQ